MSVGNNFLNLKPSSTQPLPLSSYQGTVLETAITAAPQEHRSLAQVLAAVPTTIPERETKPPETPKPITTPPPKTPLPAIPPKENPNVTPFTPSDPCPVK